MATKTKKPPKTGGASVIDIPVSFANVSIGDKTARIGVHIDRGELTVTQADKNLCEKRLIGYILAKPSGSLPDQSAFPGMEDDQQLDGAFDVKGVSFTGDSINIGLTFALGSIDVASLAKFAKRNGRLFVKTTEEIPDRVADDEPEPLDDEE